MPELIIHGITPVPRTLVFGASSTLQSEPCSFRAFHVPSARTRFVVERKIRTAFLTMSSKVELGHHPGNDLVIQMFRIVERELRESLSEVYAPLAHGVIGCNLLWLEVVPRAPHNNVVDVREPETSYMTRNHKR